MNGSVSFSNAEQPEKKLANSPGMTFVLIHPGKFIIASSENDSVLEAALNNAHPVIHPPIAILKAARSTTWGTVESAF